MFSTIRVAACCEVWPMTTKVDPAVKPPVSDSATGLVSGAGWNAFTLDYGKPQTLGTLTYFLPTKNGSHDIKVGYEYILNHYRQGINAQSDPGRRLSEADRPGADDPHAQQRRAAARLRLRSVRRRQDRGESVLRPLLRDLREQLHVAQSWRRELSHLPVPRSEPQRPVRRPSGARNARL